MNGYLLDTHALLWWLLTPDRLSPGAASTIGHGDERVLVSAGSIWEATINQAAGKLEIPSDLVAAVPANGFDHLPISALHGQRAGGLPRHHNDPFDRMLVAQAQVEQLTLITHDRALQAYDIEILPT